MRFRLVTLTMSVIFSCLAWGFLRRRRTTTRLFLGLQTAQLILRLGLVDPCPGLKQKLSGEQIQQTSLLR